MKIYHHTNRGKLFQNIIEKFFNSIPCKNKIEVSEQIQKMLETLTPKEEKVIRMRFGIGIDRAHILEEIGKYFSITKERVRQIEMKALRKLENPKRWGRNYIRLLDFIIKLKQKKNIRET
jgi:RNA polymerase sigma factor (sigma-70 family)